MLEYGTLVEIDSMTRPHKRHRAVVSKTLSPYAENGEIRILSSQVAQTLCGRNMSSFLDATKMSLFDTDGNVWSTKCKHCYGD